MFLTLFLLALGHLRFLSKQRSEDPKLKQWVWQVGMVVKAPMLGNKKAPVLVNKKTVLEGIQETYLSHGSFPTIVKIICRGLKKSLFPYIHIDKIFQF